MTRPPFAGEPVVVVVLPPEDPTLGGEAGLLEHERAEFEAEVGTRVEISETDPGEGARWLLRLDGEPGAPATIDFDPEARLVVSRAADVGGLFESINLWRTVSRGGGGTLAAIDCPDLEAVIERVEAEVADTYPSFELRGLDWAAICTRHVDQVRAAEDPPAALQRWLAELEDGHTWAWLPLGNLPYAVRVENGAATFVRVPVGTLAHASETLILDLRGNPGGNLLLATRTRDRFLREPTILGSIRYSVGDGLLSEPFQLTGEPAQDVTRWPGRLVALVDPLTFSSSEDFLLGLQGLEHVTVVARPTGGGSGRPRSLRLLPGWTLTVSTALTYDREGRCIEGAGIPVDVEAVGTDADVLALAQTL